MIERFYEEVDVIDHEEGLPGQPSGREGVKFFVNAMRQAFPDLRPKTEGPEHWGITDVMTLMQQIGAVPS